MSTLGTAIIDHEPDDVSVEEFMKRPKDLMSPWVVHGIIRRRHKLILVGAEGGSKSWLLRFVAICAAYGIQPFRHERVKPIKTLIIDLENPEDALFDSFEAILKQVVSYSPQETTVNRLWWKPAGINLRNRVDGAELENVIRVRRPDLICLGPLYAAYENNSSDFGWETAAREVQNLLKKLMVRYDFALMIEDHAPQADGTGKRVMRPYGSSFWRRWPDIGIGLEALDNRDDAFRLMRWRGDRVQTDWPKMIEWGSAVGSSWPFVPHWEDDNAF
jgi:replicative DNA helicase